MHPAYRLGSYEKRPAFIPVVTSIQIPVGTTDPAVAGEYPAKPIGGLLHMITHMAHLLPGGDFSLENRVR